MKKILSLSVSMLLTAFCFAQTTGMECSQFKKGNFSYLDSLNHTVFVKRKKNKQHEYNSQTKVKTVSKIKWVSDCEYELTLVWSDSKVKKKFYGGKIIVAITKIIEGNKAYEYSCRCEDVSVRMKNTGIMRKEKD